jgi:hypothetical protein
MSRLIRTIVARKRVLLITGLWLAAGTTAGYFLGAAENKKGLDAVTVNNTDIRNVGESVFLVYTCNNQEFERYDIDRAHLIDGQDNLYGPTEGLFQKTYSRAFEVLGGSGLTQALTYAKPVARSLGLSKRERVRYFIAGVISAASGVYVGYRLGSRDLPACDDTQILQAIRQEAFWKPVVGRLAKDLWTQANHLADLNEISPDQRPVLTSALVQIETGAADSKLFNTLRDEIKDRYVKLEQHPLQWALVDYLMFAAVLVLVAVLLAYFLPVEVEARVSKRRSRQKP